MKVGEDETGLFFRADPTSTILFFLKSSIHDLISATPMRLFTRLDPTLKNDFKGLDIHYLPELSF